MVDELYLGGGVLKRLARDSTIRRFRGRVVHRLLTNTYRFYVNNSSRGGLPKAWLGYTNWTEDFDIDDVEWIRRRVASRPNDSHHAARHDRG